MLDTLCGIYLSPINKKNVVVEEYCFVRRHGRCQMKKLMIMEHAMKEKTTHRRKH
jgi:hypothetical protein